MMRVLLCEHLCGPGSHLNVGRKWCCIHFEDKETEVLKREVTWLKLHGWEEAKPRFNVRLKFRDH